MCPTQSPYFNSTPMNTFGIEQEQTEPQIFLWCQSLFSLMFLWMYEHESHSHTSTCSGKPSQKGGGYCNRTLQKAIFRCPQTGDHVLSFCTKTSRFFITHDDPSSHPGHTDQHPASALHAEYTVSSTRSCPNRPTGQRSHRLQQGRVLPQRQGDTTLTIWRCAS